MIKITFRIILFLLLICWKIVNAQEASYLFDAAMRDFHDNNFVSAYEIFTSLNESEDIDLETVSTSKYYAALCLINVEEYDGAISELEEFVNKYIYSNFRDIALYKLGTLYFEKKEYHKCRERLNSIIKEYTASEFVGSSYYWIGKSFTVENNFEHAVEFLQIAINSKRSNKYVDHSIYSLALLYEENNDYTNAIKYYDELLAYHKNSGLAPNAQLRIGICYFYLKEYDSTVLELSDPLIKRLPKYYQIEAQYILANTFYRLKEYENAADTYRLILKQIQKGERANLMQYGLAWVYFQMHRFDDAFNVFDMLSKTARDTIAINSLYWSAECKRYSDKVEDALSIYKKFLEKYPDDKLASKVKYNLGIVYYDNEKMPSSERFLLSSTQSSDDITSGRAFTLLGELSLDKNEIDEAYNYFNNALDINSLSPHLKFRAMLGLGVSNFYLNKNDESISIFKKLIKLDNQFEKDKVNFFLAEAYFSKGNYSSALIHFKKVSESSNAVGGQALYGKAYSYFNLKDYANASFLFRRFISKYPNNKKIVDANLRLADSYYGVKDYSRASNIYEKIFSSNKVLLKNDYAYYQYSQALFKAGKSSKAIDKLNYLQEKFPASKYSDDAQYLIGWIYFQRGEFERAVKSYKGIFSRYPNSAISPIAYYSIGDSYYNIGEYDSAIVYYEKLIENYPNTRFIYDAINGIQYCYLAQDEQDLAVNYIDNFISNNPNNKLADKIFYKKGDIYFSNNQYALAKSSFLNFVESYPNSNFIPEAHFRIGKCDVNLENIDDAVERFGFAVNNYLKTDAGISSVLELSKIYTQRGNFDAAINLYDHALSSLPESQKIPEIWYMKALALIEKMDLTDAYSTLNHIIVNYSESVFAAKSKIELGTLELVRGSYKNAESLFKELGDNRLDDIGAQAQYLYGLTLYEQKKYDDAISALVRVRSVFAMYDEWYSKSLIKLGDCYKEVSEKSKAREMYRAVIKRHENDELGKEANQKLKEL